ncbi:hypothetical protein NQ317_008115, partial [Molorchus minor]
GVRFIFIVSPFHRKIAGRGIDPLLTPFIEKTKSVGFIFIVSPFHRKIAGREALDLFSSSLPSIEKSPVEVRVPPFANSLKLGP